MDLLSLLPDVNDTPVYIISIPPVLFCPFDPIHGNTGLYTNMILRQETSYGPTHILNIQEKGIMSPNTTQFVITNRVVPSESKSIHNLSLLFNRKEDIGLNSKDKSRDMCQRSQARCKIWDMRGLAMRCGRH